MDHWNETLALALLAVSGVLMAVVAFAWRRLSNAMPDLPIWRYLRRAGILPEDAANAVTAKALQQAEIACAICGSKEECRERLARSADAVPPANCPNRRLFGKFGVEVDQDRR